MPAKKLSDIELKLLQMFMVGIPGTELEADLEKTLRAFPPGGILYFSRNYEAPALIGEFSSSLQSLMKEAGLLPLFLAADQEGGKVQRFGKPFTHFPEAAVLGEVDSPKLAFDIADVMANELMAVGVNLNFWPLCDIHTRPNNPVIGRRAFSSSEEVVSRISSAIVRGFVKNGMVASVKHFPGHGDTTVDSHKVLPKMEVPWEKLLEREVKPFVKAFRAKVDVVMMAHILNLAVDPKFPASLSQITINEKLRKELRYQRLVFVDDLQMEAITQNYGKDEAIQLAIAAGNDVLIYRDLEEGLTAMEIALRYLADGKIPKERVLESYGRISEVKKRVLAHFPVVNMEMIGKVVGCEAHKAVLQALLGRSSN